MDTPKMLYRRGLSGFARNNPSLLYRGAFCPVEKWEKRGQRARYRPRIPSLAFRSTAISKSGQQANSMDRKQFARISTFPATTVKTAILKIFLRPFLRKSSRAQARSRFVPNPSPDVPAVHITAAIPTAEKRVRPAHFITRIKEIAERQTAPARFRCRVCAESGVCPRHQR